jgi:hypothetical protein
LRRLRITAGPFTFLAHMEEGSAPRTCEAVRAMLPLRDKLVHARWSGEAMWVPMGERKLRLDFEDATSHPIPGQLILYPGGVSETEILIPYGAVRFASKAGQLAGNHFASIVEGTEQLRELGRMTLYQGAQDIAIEEA